MQLFHCFQLNRWRGSRLFRQLLIILFDPPFGRLEDRQIWGQKVLDCRGNIVDVQVVDGGLSAWKEMVLLGTTLPP